MQGDDEDDDEEDGTYGEDGGDEQQPAQPLATDTLLEKDGGDIMEVSCNGQSEVALFASLASDRIALTAFGAGVQQPPQSSFDRMDLSESNENHAAESKTIVSQEEEVAPAPSSPTVPKLVVDKVVTNQQAKKLFEQSRIFIQKKVASLGNDLGDENGDDDNDSDGLEIIEIQDHQSKTTAHEHAVKSIYASKSKQPAPGVLISELRRKQLKLAEEQLKQAKIKQEIIAEQKRKEKAEAEAAKKQLREAIMAKRRLQREEEKKRKQEEMEKKRQEQEEASSGTATAEHVVSNATTPVDMVQEKPITSEAKDVPPTVGQPPPTTEEGNVEDIDVDADYIDPKAASKWDEDEVSSSNL